MVRIRSAPSSFRISNLSHLSLKVFKIGSVCYRIIVFVLQSIFSHFWLNKCSWNYSNWSLISWISNIVVIKEYHRVDSSLITAYLLVLLCLIELRVENRLPELGIIFPWGLNRRKNFLNFGIISWLYYLWSPFNTLNLSSLILYLHPLSQIKWVIWIRNWLSWLIVLICLLFFICL